MKFVVSNLTVRLVRVDDNLGAVPRADWHIPVAEEVLLVVAADDDALELIAVITPEVQPHLGRRAVGEGLPPVHGMWSLVRVSNECRKATLLQQHHLDLRLLHEFAAGDDYVDWVVGLVKLLRH